MLSTEILRLTLNFLQRATLQGGEVPAFNAVISAVGGELAGRESEEQKAAAEKQRLTEPPANRQQARQQARLQKQAAKHAAKEATKQPEKAEKKAA